MDSGLGEKVRVCVVLPALNEAATIADVIQRVPQDFAGVDELQIVVVDDGSTDDTAEIARGEGAIVVSHSHNKGVGAAFHSGVDRALELGADFMVNIDSDGQFDPADICKILEPLLKGEADFVSASRFKDKNLYPEMSQIKFYGNLGMSWLVSFLTNKKFYDVSCGFRGYTRDVLLQLNLFGSFTYTQESFLDLSYKGVRITEVPIALVCGTRQFGKSRVASNLFRYTVQTSKIIFRSFRDYRPWLVFGSIAMVLLSISICLFAFLLVHYMSSGSFSPHKWAGFTGGFLFIAGASALVTALLADMISRSRLIQERILYMLRKKHYDEKHKQ